VAHIGHDQEGWPAVARDFFRRKQAGVIFGLLAGFFHRRIPGGGAPKAVAGFAPG
jgi:hypothetical protein